MKIGAKNIVAVVVVTCILLALVAIWSLAKTMTFSSAIENWSFALLFSEENITETIILLVASIVIIFVIKLRESDND